METLKEIIVAQNELQTKADKKKAMGIKYREACEKIEKQAFWMRAILEPLAKLIQEKRGYYSYEISGPFGLGARASMKFFVTKEAEEMGITDNTECHRLEVEPTSKEDPTKQNKYNHRMSLSLVDYTINTGQYSSGSLGGWNGFNFPVVDAEDMTLDDILEFMDKQNA